MEVNVLQGELHMCQLAKGVSESFVPKYAGRAGHVHLLAMDPY